MPLGVHIDSHHFGGEKVIAILMSRSIEQIDILETPSRLKEFLLNQSHFEVVMKSILNARRGLWKKICTGINTDDMTSLSVGAPP